MKRILNSDGQQFHQYQQNEQLALAHKKDHGNPGLGLKQAQKCGSVKPVNEISFLPLLIIESLTAIQI